MSKPIYKLVDELPNGGLTVMALKSLDAVIPGQWENLIGFDKTIEAVTGESDPALIKEIGTRAVTLFNDKSQGYQNALWLYETVDSASGWLGTAAVGRETAGDRCRLGRAERSKLANHIDGSKAWLCNAPYPGRPVPAT